MKNYKKIISLLGPAERKRGISVLILVIGMALLETAGIASIMPFLAVLGNPEMLETNSFLNAVYMRAKLLGVDSTDDFFLFLGVVSFLFLVFSGIYRAYTHYKINHFVEMLRHSISSCLFKSYLHQPYSFFLNRNSGDIAKNILSEVDILAGNVFRPAFSMVAYAAVLIAIVVFLLVVNPWIAILTIVILGGMYFFVFLLIRSKILKIGDIRSVSNEKRFISVNEAFSGIKSIKMHGCEENYIRQFKKPSRQFSNSIAINLTLNQIPKYFVEILGFGGIIAIIVVMVINSGGIVSSPLGQILPIIALYAISAYRLQPAIQQIYTGLTSLRYGKSCVDNIYDELHHDKLTEELPKLDEGVKLKVKKSIILKNLCFTYPKSTQPTIMDLNIEIPVGKTLGIVGSSGSGKTTLVDIILGLLKPTRGVIMIDNSPIHEYQLSAWQRSLGYVPQEIYLTDRSIAHNIAFGVPEEEFNLKQIEYCARMAQLHDYIMQELPEQYDTNIGELGVRLSGGQRQRIGIARALYHNPEVLVFDEATSALDSITEKALMDSIDSLSGQKTIILIAHRLTTIKKCNQVVLIENGRLVAKGSYEELYRDSEKFKVMNSLENSNSKTI